jgi:hypothetical protein
LVIAPAEISTDMNVADAANNNVGGATFTYSCSAAIPTPTPTPTPNTDSQNIRLLQTAVSKSVATFSGQAITGAVDGAIGDAFNGGSGPVTPGANGLSINFAAEPPREPRVDDAFNALAYAANVNKAPPRVPLIGREWSAWADVRGTGFDRDAAGATMNGHQLNLTGGIGRRLTPDLLVGVFSGYEKFSFTMDSIAGRMTGDGGTIGTYAGWRFARNWRADGMLGWSKISYNATAGTATGAFSGSRWLASGGLTGRYNYAAVVLEPSARIYTLWESERAWTDSLGTVQGSRNFSAGRIATGGRAIYPWQLTSNARISPYVGLYGDWRFSSDNALPVGQPLVGIKNGWSGRVTTGITTTMSSGLAVSVGGELGGLGAGYEVWSANARVNWPF